MIEEFGDLEGVEIVVDDVLIWAENIAQHDERLEKFLDRVRKVGLKLNEKKSVICTQVEYVGHLLTSEGLRPSPDRIKALTEMSAPQTRAELETFLGIMVYLGKFMPNLSKITAPLRELTEEGVAWSWKERHQEGFEDAIRAATSAPLLKYYDVREDVTIATDASNKGFGTVLLQNEKPVSHASSRLLPAEHNYAAIKKEMSAILFGCTRFHDYVFANRVKVETNHKPLVGIFDKPLYKLSPRLQRMRLELM